MIISMTANYVNDVFEDWEKIGRIISYSNIGRNLISQ